MELKRELPYVTAQQLALLIVPYGIETGIEYI